MVRTRPSLSAPALVGITSSLLTLFSLSACGGNGGAGRPRIASPNRALSEQETSRFKTELNSIGQINELGQLVAKSHRQTAATLHSRFTSSDLRKFAAEERWLSLFAGIQQFPTPTSPGSSRANQPGSPQLPSAPNPLQKAVDSDDCHATMNLPDDSGTALKAGDTEIPQIDLGITGASCPYHYAISLRGTQKKDGFDAKINLSYQAVTAEAKQISDIDSLTAGGEIHATMAQAAAGPQTTMTIKMDFDLDTKGHSQAEGDFAGQNEYNVTMAIMVPSLGSAPIGQGPFHFGPTLSTPISGIGGISITGQSQERNVYQFPSFTGELKSSLTFDGLQPKEEYYLNSQAITKDEYQSYKNEIKTPGLPSENGPQQGGGQVGMPNGPSGSPGGFPSGPGAGFPPSPGLPGQPGSQPLVCTVQILKGTVQVGLYKNCGGTFSQTSQVDSETVEVRFAPSKDFTLITTTVCGSSCTSAQRYFLPNDSRSFSDQLGDLSIQSSCQAVVACPAN